MKIYYQGNIGSYMHIASKEISKNIKGKGHTITGKNSFNDVWNELKENKDNIAVLAIENSYMGSIHTNIYNFLYNDCKIIGEYYLPINHCLCSKERNIKDIKKVYSQAPALEQCNSFLKQNNIEAVEYIDTSLSAKKVANSKVKGIGAICSTQAAEQYGLNIIKKNIQDQKGNTTRFAVIVDKDSDITYNKKSDKISLIFEVKHKHGSLHKCLGVFAKYKINLSKLESIPSHKGRFDYMFFVDLEGDINDKKVIKAIKKLDKYADNIKVIGSY